MKLITLVCLLFLVQESIANVKISGEFIGLHPKQIALCLPVGNYSDYNVQLRYPVVNDKFSIDFKVTEPTFMKFFVGQTRFYLLITPNCNIKIKYFNTADKYKRFKFEGTNAAGQYWYSVYSDEPLANFTSHKGLVSNIQLQSKDKSLVTLGQYINHQVYPLDALYKSGQIDEQFYSLAKTDIRSMHAMHLIEECENFKRNCENKDLKTKYQRIIDALYRFAGCRDEANMRTYSGQMILINYYGDKLKETPKTGNLYPYKLGPYNGYQLAPNSMKVFLIGSTLLFGKTNPTGEFEFDSNYKQYKKDFSNSVYIPVIEKAILQKSASKPDVKSIIIDSVNNFNHFDEVRQHFKGKAVYIDLWATWCVPCREEFPYYPELNGLFKKHSIQKVFISIDNPLAEYQWKDMIKQNQLDGYHILANKNLQADLRKVVYKMGQVTIPRYILINKNGRVVSWDELRPSNPDLAKAFDKVD